MLGKEDSVSVRHQSFDTATREKKPRRISDLNKMVSTHFLCCYQIHIPISSTNNTKAQQTTKGRKKKMHWQWSPALEKWHSGQCLTTPNRQKTDSGSVFSTRKLAIEGSPDRLTLPDQTDLTSNTRYPRQQWQKVWIRRSATISERKSAHLNLLSFTKISIPGDQGLSARGDATGMRLSSST